MAQDSVPCPYCGRPISPRPRRARKCPHCGEQLVVRGGQLVTTKAPAGLAPAQAPPGASPSNLRETIADVLVEMGLGPGEAARFAHYKTFGSELSPREAAFAQALQFLTDLGPARVISVSHAEDQRGAVVTVWYWAPAYEVRSEGP